ncbi:MAG: FkbM family methyltransferase [Sphingomonadales bacterium]|nr:FkbM family methyltransferase [Sphingomonadales bacterium]MDE2171527.1 FkbM family methyltransferase [Sphingomonadales bacterium]
MSIHRKDGSEGQYPFYPWKARCYRHWMFLKRLLPSFAKTRQRRSLPGPRRPLVSIHDLHLPMRGDNEALIRGLCQTAYVGDYQALCRILGRYKMYVDTRDVGLSAHLMLEGFWEMWVTHVISSLVREGATVADIGANLGYYTIILAELVGPNGHVHAFEPNPHLAGLLAKNVFVNGFEQRASVHRMGLADRIDQEMILIAKQDDPKNGYMTPYMDDLTQDVVHVLSTRLDSRVDWETIEFAKIDVEGAEQLVWAGMQGLLDNGCMKTVLLEFTPDRYDDPKAFLDSMMKPGFALSRIDYNFGIVEVTPQQILNNFAANEDIMLILRR